MEEQSIWKKPVVIISIAGGFFVILIGIMVIAALSSDPMREYEGMFVKYAQDCVISVEEKAALETFSTNNKLESAKVREMESRFMADKCAGKDPAPKPAAVVIAAPVPTPPPAPVTPPVVAPTKPSEPSVDAKLNLQQGINFVKSKNYDQAINEFTVAVQKYPEYAVAYSNRAVAYMQQKKYNKAMDDLTKALEISPRDATIQYNLTALYSLQNQLDRAIDSLDRTLASDFKDYDSLRSDADLANLRRSPEFRKTLEKYKVFLK